LRLFPLLLSLCLPRSLSPFPLFPYTTLFRSSVVFLFFFLLLAACPTMQNLIPHLSQFFDDPSLGFGGFLDIPAGEAERRIIEELDRKSTRLNSSHQIISYAVFCLKKKKQQQT